MDKHSQFVVEGKQCSPEEGGKDCVGIQVGKLDQSHYTEGGLMSPFYCRYDKNT